MELFFHTLIVILEALTVGMLAGLVIVGRSWYRAHMEFMDQQTLTRGRILRYMDEHSDG